MLFFLRTWCWLNFLPFVERTKSKKYLPSSLFWGQQTKSQRFLHFFRNKLPCFPAIWPPPKFTFSGKQEKQSRRISPLFPRQTSLVSRRFDHPPKFTFSGKQKKVAVFFHFVSRRMTTQQIFIRKLSCFNTIPRRCPTPPLSFFCKLLFFAEPQLKASLCVGEVILLVFFFLIAPSRNHPPLRFHRFLPPKSATVYEFFGDFRTRLQKTKSICFHPQRNPKQIMYLLEKGCWGPSPQKNATQKMYYTGVPNEYKGFLCCPNV